MTKSISAAARAAVASASAAVLLASAASAAQSSNATQVFRADLNAMNGSGVDGHAILRLKGNELTVTVIARGLEAGGPHPGHIHGFPSGENAVCPPPSADEDGDNFVELAEGADFYGPILLTLANNLDPDLDGKITFKMTYDVTQSLLPLTKRAIVLHGATDPAGVGVAPGEVDDNNGFEPVLPVACGTIMENGNGNAMKFKEPRGR